jgi:hypothetical protein
MNPFIFAGGEGRVKPLQSPGEDVAKAVPPAVTAPHGDPAAGYDTAPWTTVSSPTTDH